MTDLDDLNSLEHLGDLEDSESLETLKSVENESENQGEECFRSGFVALVGRPSAGKSTLLNTLCGQKVAIISPKPQTTRNVIRGIVNRATCQLVFLDTPGFSERKDFPRDLLSSHLRDELHNALREAEAILYLVDLSRSPHSPHKENNGEDSEAEEGEEPGLLALLREVLARDSRPLLFAMNKVDLLPNMELREQRTAEYLELIQQYFPEQNSFFQISAKQKHGIETLLQRLSAKLPEGALLYETDIYTDQEPQFRIQELIREQALSFCGKELPYALYVEIADLEYKGSQTRQSLWVRAFLQVERDSQKGILVGKGGERIREIRKRSTRAIRKEFACPVELELQVKVDYKWRRKNR